MELRRYEALGVDDVYGPPGHVTKLTPDGSLAAFALPFNWREEDRSGIYFHREEFALAAEGIGLDTTRAGVCFNAIVRHLVQDDPETLAEIKRQLSSGQRRRVGYAVGTQVVNDLFETRTPHIPYIHSPSSLKILEAVLSDQIPMEFDRPNSPIKSAIEFMVESFGDGQKPEHNYAGSHQEGFFSPERPQLLITTLGTASLKQECGKRMGMHEGVVCLIPPGDITSYRAGSHGWEYLTLDLSEVDEVTA